ncbi:peptidoglycan-binding protein [Streptomyces sp. LUP30]|uniref:peptidoglycan-binding domain-containing protein n=1 Tax=Streptomyces sp. LUP30 TaxID=1890285 RepID=UPI000B0E05B5|nr:peptidoglycan-binding protein [Streptomyces sp. LUP30]
MIDPMGRQGPAGRQGLPCPECGALRAADNTPSCACAQRASEALRDTRTAEAAAAEDFDPLRIRPYVELEDSGPGPASGPAASPGPGSGPEAGAGPASGPADSGSAAGDEAGSRGGGTGGIRGGDSPGARGGGSGGVRGGGAGWSGAGAASAADVTMPLRPVPGDATVPLRTVAHGGPAPDTTAWPAPLGPPASEPEAGDLSLFETVNVGAAHPDGEEPRVSHRRRTLLVATAAAVVGVVAAAGFATGLFSYEKPTRERAAPQDVRAAVPDTSTEAASGSPSASRSASPSAAEASPSPSESASPSPSPSASSASPSASPSAEAPSPTPTARASASLAPGKGAEGGPAAPADVVALRRGDKGAEVTELQLRLRQLHLYNGQADGTFSGEVEDAVRNYQWSRATTSDGLGVYGPATRTALESETEEP